MIDQVRKARHLIFDLDGCVWFGRVLAPGAAELIAGLRSRGRGVYFVTNRSTADEQTTADELTQLGIPANQEEVLTPLGVLERHLAAGTSVYVVGTDRLRQVVHRKGFRLRGAHDCDAVLLGNSRDIALDDLVTAAHAVMRGAQFYALNLDRKVPVAEGSVIPGVGAFAAFITTFAGESPVLLGKPAESFFEAALARFKISASATAMIGDTYETDIQGAVRSGLDAVWITETDVPPTQNICVRVRSLEELYPLLISRRTLAAG